MSDIVERLRDPTPPHYGKCRQAAIEITRLRVERDALLIALHDAIRRPMGVVPASADPFYNPVFAAQAEVRRIEKEATMIEGVGG